MLILFHTFNLDFKVRVTFKCDKFDDLTSLINFYIKRLTFVKYVFSLDCDILAITH